jgi:hydroxymethylpyrimidine pyrophosphatase-like HAD family hydrolase
LPVDSLGALIAESRTSGRILEFYGDEAYVVERDTPWSRAHAALLGIPFAPRAFETLGSPVVRAQWLLTAREADDLLARTDGETFEVARSTSPLMPDTSFVGLTRRGVSKGGALHTIATDLGIPLAEVMYVGDAGNDLSALRIVGHPVAMGNADAEVRAAASLVVGSVEHGGLVEALDRALARASP